MEHVFDNLLGPYLTNSLEIWLAVVYLAFMFIAAIFRPGQIGELKSFQSSYRMFAAFLIVSPTLIGLGSLMESMGGFKNGRDTLVSPMWQFAAIASRILFALSIALALQALVTHKKSARPPAAHDAA